MKATIFSFISTLLLLAFSGSSHARVKEFETTREEILESRRRRSVHLEEMLVTTKKQLEDHKAGIRLLDDEQLKATEKKADVYERKLATMQGQLDDREVERIIKREKLRDERINEKRKLHNHPEL